jgi:hypothetical protein
MSQHNLHGGRMDLGGTGFQPVLAQAKACGYIVNFYLGPGMQNTRRTLIHLPPFRKGGK